MVTDNRFYLVADYSEFRAAKARAGSNAAPVCEYYDGFSFGKFVNAFPQLRGRVTDLFIGDLFDSEVDEVWGPLESLYPPQKLAIPEWNAGGQPEDAPDEVNELYLPAGELR